MPTKSAAPAIQQPEEDTAILRDYIPRRTLLKALDVTDRTLFKWEAQGDAPPRMVIGKKIYYRRDTFLEWLRAHEERHGERLSANGRRRRPAARIATPLRRRTRRAA